LSRNSSFEIDSMEFYLSRGRLQGRKDLCPEKEEERTKRIASGTFADSRFGGGPSPLNELQ